MRLLVIPVLTRLAAASPFHCYLVSLGSKRAFVRAFRTLLTNEVSRIRINRTVTAITRLCGKFQPASRAVFLPPFRTARGRDRGRRWPPTAPIDKPRRGLENRRFNSLRWKAFL